MGVLEGIRILELARVAPAELPGMMLADMGADVLKIDTPLERPQDSDERRRAAFVYVNRNKRSLALNLKSPEGQAIFRQLASSADIIVEGFRPGVMKRLGADYETIRELNPRIVYCSLSGFGQSGPYRDLPAHDLNYLSLAGILDLIGEPDRKPQIPLNLVADYAGASMHGALGIMLALFARERTGQGQHVDVSYLDSSVALLAATPNMRFFWSDNLVPRRGAGFLGGGFPYYAVYETSEGRYLTIACVEPRLWENFCRAIDRPDFVRFSIGPDEFVRAPDGDEVRAREEIQAIIRTKTRDEWWAILTQADIAVAKVYDTVEMVSDAQVRAREMVIDVAHPEHGVVRQFGIPIKLSTTQGSVRRGAPFCGEHTEAVLRELGKSVAQIADLRSRRVVG